MINKNIILQEKFVSKFQMAFQSSDIIFICAPSGYGKTTSTLNLLKNHAVFYKSVKDSFDFYASFSEDVEVIVFDDIHLLKGEKDVEDLFRFVDENKSHKFILISRQNMPVQLLKHKLTGKLSTIDYSCLSFNSGDLKRLFALYNISLSDEKINFILEELSAHPMSLTNLCTEASLNYGIVDDKCKSKTKWEIYSYLDQNLFADTDPIIKKLLVSTFFLDSFSVELAVILTEYEDIASAISTFIKNNVLLETLDEGKYSFIPLVKNYAKWKVKQIISEQEQREFFVKAARYFEKQKDPIKAIRLYAKAKKNDNAFHLLSKCADINPGMGYFYEIEPFLKSIPEELVVKSPSLMSGMSMLCALREDYEKSDYWYSKLKLYASGFDKRSREHKEAKQRLLFLDVALPQTDTLSTKDLVVYLFKKVQDKEIDPGTFGITSSLPSILNGGKDFSEWSKIDDFLYKTIRKPLEIFFKNQGVGLAECSICESKFEKGADYHDYFIAMTGVLPEIQQKGSRDVEFALIALISRVQLSKGQVNSALKTVNDFRNRLTKEDKRIFLHNVKALACHISLVGGDLESAKLWLEYDAPKDDTNIWILWRYMYQVKCEVLIALGKHNQALILLSQLLRYCDKCKKVIDKIIYNILSAICYYKEDNKLWRGHMEDALDSASIYGFVTTVSQYGTAVLPMLLECNYTRNKEFLKKVVKATRVQASFYQKYLESEQNHDIHLSNMEHQVLALICQDKSNQEICDILGIKLPTVKTHVSNTLRKLAVSKRSAAKTTALKLGLIEDCILK